MQSDCNFVLTATSPAAPGNSVALVSDPVTQSLVGYRSMCIESTLQGATGGALDVVIQVSYDKGVTWSEYVRYTQLAAAAASIVYVTTHSRAVGVAAPVVIGKGTTPTITVNTCRAGEWGDRMRVLFVAGASTSAGAVQTIRVYLHG